METKPTSSKEIIAYLSEKFPACFSVTGAAKPLKIGIFQELAQQLADDENVSKTRLRQALRHYTSSWRYLKSVKAGSQRVDLQGNEVAEIDQTQADYASKILKESQEKFASKKAQDGAAKKPNKDKKADAKVRKDKPAGNSERQSKDKFKAVKASKNTAKKIQATLKPIDTATVAVGHAVKVQVGNAPMDAVVKEVIGNDVSVELTSGMVVKTQVKNLFTE